jgi:hypothetical protein
MNKDFEKRMIHVVIAAQSREKEKVQELTHEFTQPQKLLSPMKKEIFHSGAKFNWEALLIVYTTSK